MSTMTLADACKMIPTLPAYLASREPTEAQHEIAADRWDVEVDGYRVRGTLGWHTSASEDTVDVEAVPS